ncbi:MAG: S8 family serine peptidase, partial [Candidatus Thorarchaeota archaeon]
MSLSNKSAVLLFIAVLTLSVFMTPSGPVATELASSPALSPATQEQINDWYETVAQPGFRPEIDAALAEWMETGKVADELVTTQKGVSALVVVTPGADMAAIRAVVDVDYFVNLNYFKTLKVTMNSPEALAKLAEIEGVGIIDADTWRFPIGDDLVKELDIAPTIPSDGVDMEAIYDIVGASDASVTETGLGITVGHVDTGADFGNPELQSSYNTGSYDPTGEGLTPMWYYANSTNVANATAWLEDGNLLTYVDGGKVMLNVTGWDPLLNMYGSVRYLYGDGGYTSSGAINPYNDRVGFIWLYAWAWGIQINDTWLESTMVDWELPTNNTGGFTIQGDYQLNWVFQQHNGPYAKIFAPAMVWNDTSTDEYKMAINWEDTDAWNWLWTGGFYYETLNMSHPSAGDLGAIYNKFDWNFTDDVAGGEWYDMSSAAKAIVAHDYNGDGIDDFSLGALSWCYDAFEFGDDPMFFGFSESGDFSLYWDDGSHGTATAAHVAADGLYEYEDPNSGTTFEMKGIAPDADIISVRALSGASDYFSYIWCAGFSMTNETSGEFTFDGEHMADLVTNSWGWITEPASQMNYLAFTWEILATPGILDGSYPGVLHVFSAGNEGEGYMTIGPPGAATAILSVGASTASDWLSYLYGDTPATPYEGIASFSSKGPSFTGYPKPDVLAPGLADYSAIPWFYLYYAPAWNGGPYGDEFETGVNVTLFSGTSQAAPVAAGVIALAMEAMGFDSSNDDDPFVVKMMIQHTAEDLGYDPATQGFGRISIVNFIDFYENGGYYGGTLDSAMNYADFIGDSWA